MTSNRLSRHRSLYLLALCLTPNFIYVIFNGYDWFYGSKLIKICTESSEQNIWTCDRETGVRFPAVTGIFRFRVHIVFGSHLPPSLLSTGDSFNGGKVAGGVKLTTHLHLAPRLRIRGVIPPLSHTSSWRGT